MTSAFSILFISPMWIGVFCCPMDRNYSETWTNSFSNKSGVYCTKSYRVGRFTLTNIWTAFHGYPLFCFLDPSDGILVTELGLIFIPRIYVFLSAPTISFFFSVLEDFVLTFYFEYTAVSTWMLINTYRLICLSAIKYGWVYGFEMTCPI